MPFKFRDTTSGDTFETRANEQLCAWKPARGSTYTYEPGFAEVDLLGEPRLYTARELHEHLSVKDDVAYVHDPATGVYWRTVAVNETAEGRR